jgi:exodeoxyribonuclease-3
MKIISWNVNGIRAAEKKGFIDFLNKSETDILGIQETKANKDQLSEDLLNISPYSVDFFSGVRKGYSGVAIYSKHKPLAVINGLGNTKWDDEGRVIRHDYENFTLFNIYFPNGQKDDIRLQYKLDFYDACLEHFEKLRKEGKKLIVMGDYNTAHKAIDLARPKANENTSGFLPIEREWMDKFIAHGYVDTFRLKNQNPEEYSWWSYRAGARTRNVGWRIDYVFVTEDLVPNVKDSFIWQDVMGSDHCPVGIELEF